MRYAFLDLETTGFEPADDSIIEVSIVVEEDGVEVGRLDRVTIPDKSPLSDFVTQLTGITQTEIDERGIYFAEIKDEVEALLNDTVIVGHNIDFDINFLMGNGVDLSRHERLDTHELARVLLPQESSYALEVLTQTYGFVHEDAHRAMSDVLASRDLFNLLLERIQQLPQGFLDQVDHFLRDETQWYARHLFLAAPGQATTQNREPASSPESLGDAALADPSVVETLVSGQNAFVQVGHFADTATRFKATAQALVESGQSVCIVTPKLAYFEGLPSLPTPEVLFDIKRCPAFLAQRQDQLNDGETTFYLKCLYRHYLGYRGLWQFDLFFKERDWWNEVNYQSIEDEGFASVLAEKTQADCVVCSPAGWAQLYQQPGVEGRVLLIDEGELSSEMWLKSPTQAFSFTRLLHHPNDELAQKTQFFIHRFVREWLEPTLGKSFGTFPERILLNTQDRLDRFEPDLAALLTPKEQTQWLAWLAPQDDRLVRWVIYAPESGHLTFYQWHPDARHALKAALQAVPKLIAARHDFEANDREFFRIFLGDGEGQAFDWRERDRWPKLRIPEGLVSQKSPDFNPYCVDYIQQTFENAESNVAANFSGLEALKTSYEPLRAALPSDAFLAAEKVMGGDGKLLEKLAQHKSEKTLLLYQKLMTPALEQYPWSDLVLQKFPFGAPDCLLQHIENEMKAHHRNWWNAWVMPQLTATVSRKVAQFPDLQTVHFLDARENSGWGKQLLREVFG